MIVTSALAPTFAWTGGAADFRVTPSGAPAIDVTVPTGSYRMHLGPSSGDGADFLRVAADAITAAFAADGRSETFTATMGADGRVTLTASANVTLAASAGLRALGLDAAGPASTMSSA